MSPLTSCFAQYIVTYVELRRNLGLKMHSAMDMLKTFDRYVAKRTHNGPLTQELALGFATDESRCSSDQCARRYQTIRHFADYMMTFEPETERLDPKAVRRPPPGPSPVYICTDEELARLLALAPSLSPRYPLYGVTLHAIVALAACTGLRISEVVSLDNADVELGTGRLLVRRTKFDKDRLVPVHPTVLEVLRDYAVLRDAAFPQIASSAFFLNRVGRRHGTGGLGSAFRNLTWAAGLRTPYSRGPRFHDLRHGFAVRRLVAWYRSGIDVQAMLPVLATYMGHVHYSYTAHYLQATPELLQLAAERRQNQEIP